jgi:hypothetical protein
MGKRLNKKVPKTLLGRVTEFTGLHRETPSDNLDPHNRRAEYLLKFLNVNLMPESRKTHTFGASKKTIATTKNAQSRAVNQRLECAPLGWKF